MGYSPKGHIELDKTELLSMHACMHIYIYTHTYIYTHAHMYI